MPEADPRQFMGFFKHWMTPIKRFKKGVGDATDKSPSLRTLREMKTDLHTITPIQTKFQEQLRDKLLKPIPANES